MLSIPVTVEQGHILDNWIWIRYPGQYVFSSRLHDSSKDAVICRL